MALKRFHLLAEEIDTLFKKYSVTDFLIYIDLPKEGSDKGGLMFRAEGNSDQTAHAFLHAVKTDPEFANVVENIAGHILAEKVVGFRLPGDTPRSKN